MTPRLLTVLMVPALALLLTAMLTVIDTLFTGEPVTRGDVATDFAELLVLSAAMVACAHIVSRLRDLEDETLSIRGDIEEAAKAGREWRRQSEALMRSLSEAVTAQFDRWGLTPAEADIAAMILKGASLRDIAVVRRTSEATIRQQAQSVYRKSGLANRSELAAFFLEDLFDVAADRTALGAGQDAPTH